MRAAGRSARHDGVCYLTGGSSAVLLGWRQSTLDIDVRFEPEQDEVMRELPRLKRELEINVEVASPAEFIPLPAGWEGPQHSKDMEDVAAMIARELVDPARLRAYYEEIEPELYRFPAISPERFRGRVEQVAGRRDST